MTDEKKPEITPEDGVGRKGSEPAAMWFDEWYNDPTLWDEANIIRGQE